MYSTLGPVGTKSYGKNNKMKKFSEPKTRMVTSCIGQMKSVNRF